MIGKVITEIVFDAGPEEICSGKKRAMGVLHPTQSISLPLTFETSVSLTSVPLCYTPPRLHPGCGLHSEQLHLGNLNFDSFSSCVLLSSIFQQGKKFCFFF